MPFTSPALVAATENPLLPVTVDLVWALLPLGLAVLAGVVIIVLIARRGRPRDAQERDGSVPARVDGQGHSALNGTTSTPTERR